MAIDPLSAALDIGGKLIDRLWPDPTQRDAAKLELLKMQQTGELAQLTADTELAKGQLEINKIEAASSRLWVAGARPFIMWTCGAAFAYHFLLQPLLAFIFAAAGHPVALPAFDMNTLFTVTMTMLGMGSMRTFEKYKGVDK